MERESFSSRLGFILTSAGCAIGLGNVWRFPYITGKYGGAAFIMLYLLFLVIFGLPIMSMEFAVGRAGRHNIVGAFTAIEKKGTKWHRFGYFGIAGNYILVFFYTTITGWMFYYFVKMLRGDFVAKTVENINAQFGTMAADPVIVVGFMILTTVLGFVICSGGLEKSVEKITKVMMIALLAIILILAIHVMTLDGAKEGLKYYLVPDFKKLFGANFGEALFAAMGQAFFTLSIGMGSMLIFGSYIDKDKRLFGESISIAVLDTFVAIMAGLIIIPACFAYNIDPGAGPGLVFQTLPVVFSKMAGGRIWGSLFFLFMIFAAMSTIIAVFENIVCFSMEVKGYSRKKAALVNTIIVILCSLPCALGFNLLSFIEPMGAGSTILDLEDFIISNNIQPLGSLVFVLFCVCEKKGWGFDNFLEEVNSGTGIKFPRSIKYYVKYGLPIILLAIWIQGYIAKFFVA